MQAYKTYISMPFISGIGIVAVTCSKLNYIFTWECIAFRIFVAIHNIGEIGQGWRSNNIGEIGQGKFLEGFRKCHPFDFFSLLIRKTFVIITSLATSHRTWREQDVRNVTRNLVPDGLKRFLDNNAQAVKCKVTRLGNGGTVVYYLPRTGTTCIERFVDMEKQTCTCGLWERNRFPCHHAIAVAVNQGQVAAQFVAKNCHKSYFINDIILSNIANALTPLLAPTGKELELPENRPGYDLEDMDAEMMLQPPPRRVNEKHGNCNRKRKTMSSKASKSLGSTHTSTYAQASRTTLAKKAARQVCFKCVRAGRVVDVDNRHKAKMCPWSVPDISAVALKIPEMPRLRNQAKTAYNKGVPTKLQKPRTEKKPRILSCISGQPIEWVTE
jgi:hypothetical protein